MISGLRKPIAVEARDMAESESLQRVIEGLKLSLSCSREMQAHSPKQGWGRVTEGLAHLLASARKLAHAKAQTRQGLLHGTDEVAWKMRTDA